NGLVEIGNRSVVVALVQIRSAPEYKGVSVVGVQPDCLAGGRDSPVVVTVVEICVALAHQGRVARSRLRFSLFAPLLLCPESGEPLLLRFLTLALRFRLGSGFGLALLLRLRGGLALFFSLLSLCPRFRLGCGFGLALFLRLRGSEALSFSLHSLRPRFRLGCGF